MTITPERLALILTTTEMAHVLMVGTAEQRQQKEDLLAALRWALDRVECNCKGAEHTPECDWTISNNMLLAITPKED